MQKVKTEGGQGYGEERTGLEGSGSFGYKPPSRCPRIQNWTNRNKKIWGEREIDSKHVQMVAPSRRTQGKQSLSIFSNRIRGRGTNLRFLKARKYGGKRLRETEAGKV